MPGRNVYKKIKNIISEKFHGKCAFPNCKWPATNLHHTKRFSIVKRHLTEEIVPLCKIHHELAHAGLIKNEEDAPDKWELKNSGEIGTTKAKIDKIVRAKRKTATILYNKTNFV